MLRDLVRPILVASLCAGAYGSAYAQEAAVKQGVEAFAGSPVVESVAKTPYGGLYEVVLTNGQLVYTDATVSFLVDGRVIDTKSRLDVTKQRLEQLSAIDFSTLPLDHAIKQVKGNGERVLVSFEDPNCGYCKRLGQELTRLDNVTIYTFLYPILSQDSHQKSKNIWCAQDQSEAWNAWILAGKTPPSAECDSSVVEQNVALGRSLNIQGTPTMFLADGTRLGGYLPADQLEQAIDAAQSKK